jgi:Fe-S-cluster-containing hydrogenase component 2
MDCTKCGFFSEEQIVFPPWERVNKKAVAVIECCQQIPCNPCQEYCPIGAITVEDNINAIPKVDYDKCTGCGICLGFCPGLAIFLIDGSKEYGVLTIPYELFPPNPDETVILLDRAGNSIGQGSILSIRKLKQHDRTLLISIKIDKDLLKKVRGFRRIS